MTKAEKEAWYASARKVDEFLYTEAIAKQKLRKLYSELATQ